MLNELICEGKNCTIWFVLVWFGYYAWTLDMYAVAES